LLFNLFTFIYFIIDELQHKQHSNLRNEINHAQKNLHELKYKLGHINKGSSDQDDITNLLFAKSNDIINNANNFINKYKNSKNKNTIDDDESPRKNDENNDSEIKDNKNNYEDENNTHSENITSGPENFERKDKLNYENVKATIKLDERSKLDYEKVKATTKISGKDKLDYEKQKATVKLTDKDRDNIKEKLKQNKDKIDKKSKKHNVRSPKDNSNDFKRIGNDSEELLARIDKLLISNGLLDKTNKDLVMHLKLIENEQQYVCPSPVRVGNTGNVGNIASISSPSREKINKDTVSHLRGGNGVGSELRIRSPPQNYSNSNSNYMSNESQVRTVRSPPSNFVNENQIKSPPTNYTRNQGGMGGSQGRSERNYGSATPTYNHVNHGSPARVKVNPIRSPNLNHQSPARNKINNHEKIVSMDYYSY